MPLHGRQLNPRIPGVLLPSWLLKRAIKCTLARSDLARVCQFVKWLGGEGMGRSSWDEVAILLAARGAEKITKITSPASSVYKLVRGSTSLEDNPRNAWSAIHGWSTNASAPEEHFYLEYRDGVSHIAA